jgi:hypothetical protein
VRRFDGGVGEQEIEAALAEELECLVQREHGW